MLKCCRLLKFVFRYLDIGLMTESESAHPNSQPEFAEFAPVDESELINELDEASSKNAESVTVFWLSNRQLTRFSFHFFFDSRRRTY